RRVLISPSLMCADQMNLGAEVDELVGLGVDWLHLDIMDGHYVPNLTFGTDQCQVLGERSSVPLDIHLMVDEPDRWAPVFAGFGRAPYVTIHPETTWHAARILAALREVGAHPGIAIDPTFSPDRFSNLFGLVDLVLIMAVNPGYAGQKLLPWTLDSVRRARELRDAGGHDFLIEVDGNVSWANIPQMLEAGADVLVAGSSSLFDPQLTRVEAMGRLVQFFV
ncbi:MAG: ribulose-phosphate 3-epimerase, partial [Spirochaetaceae bacterium]|nr:ribulose-phosphate 3-epimerase [Spirochaetaceae bacterium]